MPDTPPRPATLLFLAAFAVGAAAAGCTEGAGGGADLRTPGFVTDPGTDTARSTVVVTPALDTVRVGDTARFAAVVTDSFRTQQGERPVHWSIGDTAIGVVDPNGFVRALRAGTTLVIAAVSDSDRATATLVVLDTTGTGSGPGVVGDTTGGGSGGPGVAGPDSTTTIDLSRGTR